MNSSFRITVILTEKCNLACKYCYVCDDESETITSEIIDAIIIRAEEKINQGSSVCLDLFGGEPLLVWDKTKEILLKLNRLSVKYPEKVRVTIFTNGTLLTEEILNFTKDLHIHVGYNFSLDGCEVTHNTCRIYKDGSGSYKDVIRGIELYCKVYDVKRESIITKCMISPYNLTKIIDTAKEFLQNGFKRISFSLIRDDVWDDKSIEIYKKEISKLSDFYMQNISEGIWYDILSIPILDRKYKKSNFCDAGKTHYAVTPSGDIYPCQRFYNNRSGFKIGDVFNGIYQDNKWSILFKGYSTDNILGCNKCKTFPNINCTGQCIAAMWEASKNVFLPIHSVCELIKFNYIQALKVYSELKDEPNYVKTLDINYYGG